MLLSSRAVKSMNLVDEEPDNSVITNNFALLLPILSFKDDLKTTSEIGVWGFLKSKEHSFCLTG